MPRFLRLFQRFNTPTKDFFLITILSPNPNWETLVANYAPSDTLSRCTQVRMYCCRLHCYLKISEEILTLHSSPVPNSATPSRWYAIYGIRYAQYNG